MFKVDDEKDMAFLSKEITTAEKNYVIQPHDRLEVRVYTNKGERIIDPNYELRTSNNLQRTEDQRPEFLVMDDGKINLPMIGIVNLSGLKISDAEEYLVQKYSEYYQDAFVIVKYLNKRVVILGAPGGQVIPLIDENMSLLEIIALAGGINEGGKAHNIRLIRGDLQNPEVFLIDLSTIDGMRKSQLSAEPGDIIYVEPVKKVITESVRDVMLVMGFAVNVLTMIVLISKL